MQANGWAQRQKRSSIVFHYWRSDVTICARKWRDIAGPTVAKVHDGKCCPECVALRNEEQQREKP